MKTQARRFLDSRSFLVLTGLLYLALAGLLLYILGARTKPEIEAMLTKLIPKVLWVNFLLIAVGVVLCWRDIAGAFRGLFAAETRRSGQGGEEGSAIGGNLGEGEAGTQPGASRRGGADPGVDGFGRFVSRLGLNNRPGVWLLLVFIVGLILVSQVAPQIHRIYYDEDIYANMGQNIAHTGQVGMANYGTFEYGEYFVNWLLYNKDPAGWPFLMSLVFQLFGTDETLAFYLNNLLFAGGILIVFFIARMLAGGSPFPALLAALVYALIPHNLIWANTIAAENAAAVFGGFAVLCALAWLRTGEARRLFLLAAVLPFACHMRPESALIAMWVFAAAAINLFSDGRRSAAVSPAPAQRSGALFRHPLATRCFWAIGLIPFALILPLVWHFYAMSGQSWGAEGAKFATFFFTKNLAINGPYFLNNKEFPILFTLLALIGLAAGMARTGRDGRRAAPRSALLMLPWFLLFWGIFLFFYAGSYKYGADVRFSLVCFMPLAVLSGMGGEALRGWLEGLFPFDGERADTAASGDPGAVAPAQAALAHPEERAEGKGEGAPVGGWPGFQAANRLPVTALLVLLLLISWLKFVPLIRTEGQEAWGARYDHQNAREFIRKIPNRAIVVTHIPSMFLVWGQNAIQSYAGINNPEIIRDLMARYNGHVYFHKSYWCNTVNDANRSVCDGIGQRYDLEPVAVAREQSHEYGLYRMTFKK